MSHNKPTPYTRVSTGDQQSQAAQLEITRKAEAENGLPMNPGYEDERHNEAAANRPVFQQMIAGPLSDEKPFDTTIVYDHSRFSRNASDLTPMKLNR